jgi:hypothetical protein
VEGALRDVLHSYRRSLRGDQRHLLGGFRFVEAARKVVGVGSVGTRAWIVLMLGNHDGDPLFLQAKEAQTSMLEPFLGKSKHANHGQRVVEGQRLTQSASDIFLGWVRSDGVDGVARLLHPPALGREGIGDHRGDEAVRVGGLCPSLRSDTGPRPRPRRRRAVKQAVDSGMVAAEAG